MKRLTPEERRAALEKKRAQIEAQLKGLNAQEREENRKRDTRRKVVAGAIALEQIARDPTGAFALQLKELLHQYVEERSRELFPFLPKLDQKPNPEKPAALTPSPVQPPAPPPVAKSPNENAEKEKAEA